MFHSTGKTTRPADVSLTAFEDGTLHLSVYDFFEIGCLDLGHRYKVLQHFNHIYSSTQGLLVLDRVPTSTKFSLLPLDLQLISETGTYLALISSKSTELQGLLRYISDTQTQLRSEFTACQDLPQKFMSNLEQTLTEKGEGQLTGSLYQLVATGSCGPSVREWLVDELGDRVCTDSPRAGWF